MEIQTTVVLENSVIANLMVSCLETGASSSWLQDITPLTGTENFEKPWYSDPKFYEGDFELKVLVDKEFGDDDVVITKTDFQLGLAIFFTKHLRHYFDAVKENDDATTADVFFQCVVFKEELYS